MSSSKGIICSALLATLILSLFLASASAAGAQSSTLTFAAFGDYGVNDSYQAAVATMVNGWNPDLILTLGDNYYAEAGGTGSEKYDLSVGKYYCNFLKDITTSGTLCPVGQASINRFFPALGDHDYDDAGMTNNLPTTYTDYFHLPGDGYTSSSNNERYYDFVAGPVHFFVLNSLGQTGWEPDGTSSSSVQAQWLRTQMGASTSTWNVVVVHNPPYSSGAKHGSTPRLQWPFAQWGADAVLSGDDHIYERIHRDGIVYFINGLGGAWPYALGTPVEGSAYRFTGANGAMRVMATTSSLTFEFHSVQNGGTLLDYYTITTPHNTATPTLPVTSTSWNSPTKQVAIASAGDGNGYEVAPTAAYAADDVFAMDMDSGTNTSTNCTDSGKDKHKFTNYNMTLPPGAVVQGIEVRLDAMVDSLAGSPKLCVTLSWDGGSTWVTWKNVPMLSTGKTTYLFGSPTDGWGRAWAPSEFSNANFQLRIADVAADLERDFFLDWAAVKIHYSQGPTPTSAAASATPSPTNTLAPTFTSTPTSTSTPTATSSSVPTATWTSTSTVPPTLTNTSVPSTLTLTPTATNSPVPTATWTSTSAVPPTLTNTSVPSTPTSAPTNTATATATAQATNTSTSMPTNTLTATSTAQTSQAPTATATKTSTPAPVPPGKVALTAPSGAISTTRPAYNWNADSLATWYYLWVNGPSGNVIKQWHQASAICAGGICSVSPAVTLSGGTYTWWVQTWNPYGYGPWSTGLSFSVPIPKPPVAAMLIGTQESLLAGRPVYQWNEVVSSAQGDAATWYYLWVNGPSGNVIKQWYQGSAVCNEGLCSVAPAVSLQAGSYTWWVQTWNSAGYGPWSSSRTFTVAP